MDLALPNDAHTDLSPFSSTAFEVFPFPYHLGMHSIFAVYSSGLLIIAVGITSYFIATILAETAQTGTPFGRRFNKAWVPLRIIMAFGLLMPLNVGLNSAQYIVLYAAKYGSAFATNGWAYFNDTLTAAYVEDGRSLISLPNPPSYNELNRFLFVAKTCKYVQDHYTRKAMVAAGLLDSDDPLPAEDSVQPYIIANSSLATFDSVLIDPSAGTAATYTAAHTPYQALLNVLDEGAQYVSIRYGIRDDRDGDDYTEDNFKEYKGRVKPVCGEIAMQFADTRDGPPDTTPDADGYYDPLAADYAAYEMQSFYYWLINGTWFDGGWWSTSMTGGIDGESAQGLDTALRHVQLARANVAGLDEDPVNAIPLSSKFVDHVNSVIGRSLVVYLYDNIRNNMHSKIINSHTYEDKGWAAAGIWYNRIAEMNGRVSGVIMDVPTVKRYPMYMEEVARLRAANNQNTDATERFNPELASVDSPDSMLSTEYGMEFATVLWKAYSAWGDFDQVNPSLNDRNPILAAIGTILGTDGLYMLRRNPNTHPLAMLAGVGRSLVESSVSALGYATLSTVFAVVGDGAFKQLAKLSANFFVTVAMMGLTVGIVLFYVVPFLPFIYFFFAVGGWIKGIFEAMVGAPLWALAHIRIDGHGLSGSAAINGYFLIFEVFVRPILIVFGLLASISIFAALVSVLNNIFSLVVDNAVGYDLQSHLLDPTSSLQYMRSLIDEFFFTVIYAIIVYLIGMSSFKLIDTVPNNILRWMGQSVATFGDQRENPAEGLVSRMSVGSQQVMGKVGGGLHTAIRSVTK